MLKESSAASEIASLESHSSSTLQKNFADGAVFINSLQNPALLCFGAAQSHRPHMVYDGIFDNRINEGCLTCIFQSNLWMYGTVSSFYGTLLLIQISPVIVIQIMKKAGSCGAAGIQMESPCYQKCIIRDIQRVLKS